MGYQTRYTLDVKFAVNGRPVELIDNTPLVELIRELRTTNENAELAIDAEGCPSECIKWYEHETELREFSIKHPSVLFSLHGEGEENEDIWNKYFLGGKVQIAKAQMTIAPFDPKELK